MQISPIWSILALTQALTDLFMKEALAAEAHLHLGLEKLKRLISQVLYKEQSVHYNEVKHLKNTLLGIYTAKKIKVTRFN